jgi:hypothetical protein
MKLLSNLLVICLCILALMAVIPLISFGFTILFGVIALAIWLLPVWIIATSSKTTGYEKVAWILAMIFLSWFAWIFYFFLAPLKPRQQYYY